MMKTLKTQFSKNVAFWCWGYAAILYLLARCAFKLYSDVDNYALAVMVNGQFGQFGSQFMSPVLCAAMYVVSLIFPAGDGFSLVLLPMSFFAFALVLTCVTKSALDKQEKGLWIAIVSATWFWARILSTNFTVNAVFFLTAGMAIEFFSADKSEKSKHIWPILFFLLGTMLRPNVGLLTIPYLLLHYGTDFFFSQKNGEKARFKLLLAVIPFVCIGIVFLIGKIYYTIPEFRSAEEYNTLLGAVVDYPVLPYSDISAPAFRVSEPDYDAVTNWIQLHSRQRMKEIFSQIQQYGACTLVSLDAEGMRILALNLYWEIMELLPKLIFPAFTLLGLFGLGIIRHIPWYRLAEMLCAWAGSVLILIYYTYKGRAPLRIWLTVLILCMMTCILALFSDRNLDKNDKKDLLNNAGHRLYWVTGLNAICCTVVAACLLYFSYVRGKNSTVMLAGAFCLTVLMLIALAAAKQPGGQQLIFGVTTCVCAVTVITMLTTNGMHIPQSPLTARTANEFGNTQDLCDGVDLYFHSSPYSGFREQGKLPSREFVRHNLSLGGWTYGQPYFNVILENYGIDSSEQALMEREHTYLIATEEPLQLVLAVLRQDYGDTVCAVQCGSYDNVPIWVFVK